MQRAEPCPICKSGMLRTWNGTETFRDVTFVVTGKKCAACSEVLFDDEEMRRQERALASGLTARGIRAGVEFKLVRKALGLKATEVAVLLDVRPETVSRWENDELPLPRLAAFALGELFERPRVARAKLESMSRS